MVAIPVGGLLLVQSALLLAQGASARADAKMYREKAGRSAAP